MTVTEKRIFVSASLGRGGSNGKGLGGGGAGAKDCFIVETQVGTGAYVTGIGDAAIGLGAETVGRGPAVGREDATDRGGGAEGLGEEEGFVITISSEPRFSDLSFEKRSRIW